MEEIMAKELLVRSQVAKEDTWAIEDLYASEELFLEDAHKLEKMIEELEEYTESDLTTSSLHLLEYFKKLEKIAILLDRGLSYSQRNGDVDTSVL